MPELPDVERFRRVLQEHALGRPIASIQVRDRGIVRNLSGVAFARRLQGRTFTQPTRRGKWLLAPTDGPTLLVHFGMTGSLVWSDSEPERGGIDRVAISFDQGSIIYRDQRRLGGLWLATDESSIGRIIGDQGPDALGLSSQHLEERLGTRRGAVKTTLMDQGVIAGVGNTLSDEVLWRARIQPQRGFGDLSADERHRLDLALQLVLRASVKNGAIPRSKTWLTSQRSQPDPTCPRCDRKLEVTRVGGRTAYWCRVCQPPSPRRR